MKKRFKSKNKSAKKILLKIIIFLFIIYFSFILTFKFLFEYKLSSKINDEIFIKYLVSSSLNNINAKNFNELFNFNLTNPKILFKLSFNNMFSTLEKADYTFSSIDEEEPKIKTEYIADPNPVNISKPLVYIYNTHQTENYSMENLAPYNIKPNVLMASYILKENLNDLGIPTVVETNNITEILRINNWQYAMSYTASRLLIEDVLSKNNTIEYLIDIHRDSSSYDKTTTEIAGKKYAKILFVVGKEHQEYQKNLNLATKINELLKEENPDLSRGITIKEGAGVNGIYNQDLSSNALLIEIGGQYNSIEEVNNTIPLLAKILFKHIRGGQS